MAFFNEISLWEDGIYRLENTDRVKGYDATNNTMGMANKQASQLANRTLYLKEKIMAVAGTVYGGNTPYLYAFGAAGKRKLLIREGVYSSEVILELDVPSILDTGSLVGGKDYYVFRCPSTSDHQVVYKVSLSKTYPQEHLLHGITLLGGFHTLCTNAGSSMSYVEGGVTKQHPLNGYVAGDILPMSVWCSNHRPYSEPEGMVYIPSLDFWCDIYLQSGSGANTKSAYQGAITRSRQYVDFVEDQFCVKKELLDDGEFAAAMLGSNEQTNIANSAFPSNGAGGHSDTTGRRMISIYGVEEGCGLLWQWLRTTSAAGLDGTIYGQTDDTPSYGYITMTQSSYGPYGQAGGKGSFYGLTLALRAGGAWYNGADCGSRARAARYARSRADSYSGGRGRSRPKRLI